MSTKTAIQTLRDKQGSIGSINPTVHADILEEVHDSLETQVYGVARPDAYDDIAKLAGARVVAPNGLIYKALVDTVDGAFDYSASVWEPETIRSASDPLTVRRRLESLARNNRLPATAVGFEADTDIVYVSNGGHDTENEGRSANDPVRTLFGARALSNALSANNRVIVATGSDVFNENWDTSSPINLDMPNAILIGNLRTTTARRTSVKLARVQGNVNVAAHDHYELATLAGNATIYSPLGDSGFLKVGDFESGDLTFAPGSNGTVRLEIDQVYPGFVMPTIPDEWTVNGWVGDTLYGTGTGTGDSPHAFKEYTNLASAGNGWYNLVTWEAGTPGDLDTHGTDFILFLKANNTDALITQRLNVNIPVGLSDSDTIANTMMRIIGRIASGNIGGGSIYRIIRETADINSRIMLQLEVDSGNNYQGIMSSLLPIPYAADTTFGSDGTIWTPTGSEVVLASMNTTVWDARHVVDGSNGGVFCESVGSHAETQAWIDFSKGTVDNYANDQKVAEFSATGSRFAADEYPTAQSSYPDGDTLFDAGSGVGSIRLTTDLPRGQVITTPVKMGTMQSLITNGQQNFSPAATADYVQLRVRGFHAGQIITLNATGYKASSSGTAGLSLVNGDGSRILSSVVWNNVSGQKGMLAPAHTATDADEDLGYIEFRLQGLAGNPTNCGFTVWNVTVEEVQPAREDGALVQFDSNYRGILDPRMLVLGGHPDGTRGLSYSGRRPFYLYENQESWISTFRVGVHAASTTKFYFADGDSEGDVVRQGWEPQGSGANLPYIVNDLGGYPALLHCNDLSSSDVSGIKITPTAADDRAGWNNGWQWNFSIRPDASVTLHYRQVSAQPLESIIEGRWLISVGVTGADCVITPWAGTALTIVGGADKVHNLKVSCPPNSNVATIDIEGQASSLTLDYATGTYPTEIQHSSGSPNGVGRSFYLLSSTFFALQTTTKALTRKDIENNYRYYIPEVQNGIDVTIPLGTYPLLANFSVINGASTDATVEVKTGVFVTVPAGTEVVFTQSAFPRGNTWLTK